MSESAMDEDNDAIVVASRGVPLVATWPRFATVAAGGAAAMVGLAYAYLTLSHAKQTLAGLAGYIVGGALTFALFAFVLLRAEESRLARELRTARSGTALIRGMILRRRQKAHFLLRLFSTTFGQAAVLLAEGDRSGAISALGSNSMILNGGRLQQLRVILDADIERASGTSVGLERCAKTLLDMPRIGNTEADRYRTHVLVKAILEQAADDRASDLAAQLATSKDEEERLYGAWLSTWFALEGIEHTEAELRLATLLARSHGADDLVAKLEARVAERANPAE